MIPETDLKKRRNMNVDEDITKVETQIDKELLRTSLVYEDRIETILFGEYSKQTRDKIAEKYKKEGHYSKVEHSTSSENRERAGLTLFVFYY